MKLYERFDRIRERHSIELYQFVAFVIILFFSFDMLFATPLVVIADENDEFFELNPVHDYGMEKFGFYYNYMMYAPTAVFIYLLLFVAETALRRERIKKKPLKEKTIKKILYRFMLSCTVIITVAVINNLTIYFILK